RRPQSPAETAAAAPTQCGPDPATWTTRSPGGQQQTVIQTRDILGGALDFSRAAVDSSHLRAMKGGLATGRSPVDRGKTGSKHHLIVEGHGIPLAAITTGGNRNDVTQLIPLLQAVPPVRGTRGRPRQRPDRVYADRGYDHDKYRRLVRELGITPVIARRGTEQGSGLGVHRWVVEAAFALLHWFRRLRTRWEIRDDIHQAFLTLGCAIICWRRLRTHLP
ncbi:IS5 family transposase, partial [Streptomyces sp. NPDC001093]|uniref:IS5 family transposase n=1 Tax=Streptomyces sp. NPDC001093 TaxID=3154376 RepID=UPI00331D8588